ncbi:MAG TPA: triose-phosphate isomerase [Bacteroidia bacterium]|nr:triose-phosphate isomerase [Bacteroidia bacterium]
MRTKIIAGNWKMNKTYAEALTLAAGVRDAVKGASHPGLLTLIAPPFPFLAETAKLAEDIPGLHIAAQNCHQENAGAYTGEVSASMIASCGATHVIIGHSERRNYFGENDATLLKKTMLTLEHSLVPVFCIGETLAERESKKHFETIAAQLENGLFPCGKEAMKKIVIAYEPVWAIGTGVNATPAQAQEMHAFIRACVEKNSGKEIAAAVPVLYGGSCNAGNAASLFACADVDGGLIGGASLRADEFASIRKSMLATLA